MPEYRAYGLAIRSAVPLPELHGGTARHEPGSAGAAGRRIAVRLASLDDHAADLRRTRSRVRVTSREARLLWEGVGVFVVRAGCEILVDPCPGADDRLVRTGILGPALATLLQQAGYLVLHASVVDLGPGAVAFLGPSGAGKSTLAAAFQADGCRVVADDIAAVRPAGDRVEVYPGAPLLKLWPDALQALRQDPAALPRIDPESDKRGLRLPAETFAAAPVPLERLYVLSAGEDPEVRLEPLSPRECFLRLVGYTYGAEWLRDPAGPAAFLARTEVARLVPGRRLHRPWALEALRAAMATVRADAA